MGLFVWSLIVCAVAVALSPTLRKALVSKVLFPAGYFLYTRQPGFLLHRHLAMSSAAAPKQPHTTIGDDAITHDGAGDSAVRVVPIPVLEDNYAYLLLHAASKTAALVDPADPAPILAVLKEQYADYKLSAILTTHRHWDHAGGNIEIAGQFAGLRVIGGVGDSVAGATEEVTEGDVVQLAPHFSASVFSCPCHTRGHVIFRVGRLLFTGDTLFTGGCGKFFEGNGEEMYYNLQHTIGRMDDDTHILPGHEYTVGNLEFATWLQPDNKACADKFAWAKERRQAKLPTIPSTLAEEKSYNPFMRVTDPSVVARVSRVLGFQSSGLGQQELGVRMTEALRTLKNENAHKKHA